MKVRQNLSIRGTADALYALIPRLDAAADLAPGWRRDVDVTNGHQGHATRGASVRTEVCYVCTPVSERPGGRVSLQVRRSTHERVASEVYVSRVVPTARRQLESGQHNRILSSFAHDVVNPAIAAAGCNSVIATLTAPDVGVDEWVGAGGEWQLRSFSSLPIRSVDNAAPDQQRQWFGFVVGVHSAGKRLHPSDLVRWLVEEAGWNNASARNWAREYQRNVTMLQTYDGYSSAP